MSVRITRHARQRCAERLGVSGSHMEKMANTAHAKGKRYNKVSNRELSAKMFHAERGMDGLKRYTAKFRYGAIWIFRHGTLITVYRADRVYNTAPTTERSDDAL